MKETASAETMSMNLFVVNDDSLLLDVFNSILHDYLWENSNGRFGQFNCSKIQNYICPNKITYKGMTNLLSELDCVLFLAVSYLSFLYRSQN